MKNAKSFFYSYFLFVGIIWFMCAIAILVFRLNFQATEIVLTLVIPLAYFVFKKFEKKEPAKVEEGKME
jgi:hypothetical protein